jgi:6-pyruvoyltetrahydropterin/6-carboxytetrahydropterin synthase
MASPPTTPTPTEPSDSPLPHFLLSAEAAFAAAHSLPDVPKCERLHGHNWRLRLTVHVDAADLDERGMGVDFRILEQLLHEAVAEFDHQYLNELPAFQAVAPTAEQVVRLVSDRVTARLPALAGTAHVEEVTLWEMPQYRIVYRPE